MKQLALKIFDRLGIGDRGENMVFESIHKLLKGQHDHYFLIPKAKISNGTSTIEIDLTLLHATLGIFAIEVKNWSSLDSLNSTNDPYKQVSRYKDILLGLIEDNIGKIPINVEYRVIFPQISRKEGERFFENNKKYKNYMNHTLFKEDIENKENFKYFFGATHSLIPNKKEFLAIASLLVDKKSIKEKRERILPVITQDEILFFDFKQLSILNGYTGGFRIIRGVAGTGKTVILTNFVKNRLKFYNDEKFLILCFNKKLKKSILDTFDKNERKSVAVLSLFELLNNIGFDEERVGITQKDSLDEVFAKLKTKEATNEFREKFRARLRKKPIDLFLCDETQDMPPNFMRVIYEEIGDCIFFIDEAQKFYSYSMDSIAEVFHHPDFPKLSMRGRVKNLKNVYRTPSNIARCAFEILSHDKKLNEYYRKSHYLQKNFLSDINFLLQKGRIEIGNFEEPLSLKELLQSLDQNQEIAILTQYRSKVEELRHFLDKNGYMNVKVMTFQSIKGLEADTVILHDFHEFLRIVASYENSILFRKVYVLLTRAREALYISWPKDLHPQVPSIKRILSILQSHQTIETSIEDPHKLTKLMPTIKEYKEQAEMVVLAAELFGIVAGLFA